MKQAVIGLFLAAGLTACATTTVPSAWRTTSLSGAEASKVLKQCSRPTPAFQSIYALSPSEKSAVDAQLDKLATMKDVQGRSVRALGEYVYQYAGFVEKGTRKIYVNAIVPPPDDIIWQSQALIICDGGDLSFGAVYNPTVRAFSQFAINGSYAADR